ncbi:hypothetical protein FHS90_000751 [Rufibacter quisquiliarum]|uniref:Uncharacterized protein n=1 Tax=Rufibacter quisquiliarum TaxID=1549639 RepID=A0A839GH84_9BACT|nr:hypothetical protein [Rufibacter quisquiliarum]
MARKLLPCLLTPADTPALAESPDSCLQLTGGLWLPSQRGSETRHCCFIPAEVPKGKRKDSRLRTHFDTPPLKGVKGDVYTGGHAFLITLFFGAYR